MEEPMSKSALIVQIREGESVWIGDVELKLKDVRGKRVDLLFFADRSVPILRDTLKKREEALRIKDPCTKE
jgi:sRNA-binding carbon storage regulator CsrA